MASEALLMDQIKKHEGLRLKVYKCPAGKLTIGYGRNLEDRGINHDEAELMLACDIVFVKYRIKAEKHEGVIFNQLNDARQAVLINMGFNLGISGLFKFKKMWAALERMDFSTAAVEMLASEWAQQVGKRALELAAQMKTGQWAASWERL